MKTNFFFSISFAFFSIFSFGQAGTLDLTFNSVGYNFINTNYNILTGWFFRNLTSVLQTDGKILIAGNFIKDIGQEYNVLRLNTDGTVDTTFGVNGFFNLSSNNGLVFCGITVQPDGKIVYVAEFRPPFTSENRMIIIRINSNGTIDSGFGTSGFKIVDINTFSSATCVKIQNDNKILVGGESSITSTSSGNFTVVRLMPDGAIDTAFGTNGITQIINDLNGLDATNSAIYALDILPNGKILCSGNIYQQNNTFQNFCTVQYNNDGSLDTSFGDNGIVVTAVDIGGDIIYSQAIQPDGKIVLAGIATDGVHYYLPIMRLNPNGSVDNTFGINGLVSQDIQGIQQPYCKSIKLQPDGKIVAVGYGYSSFIARFNSNGSLDTTFNNIGFNVCDFNPSPLSNNGRFDNVFVLADGKLLATGYTDYENGIFGVKYVTIARFNSETLSTNSLNSNKVNISPNPTQNKVFFNNSINQYERVAIYNYLGQEIGNQKLLFTNNQEIDLSNYSFGVYILKLSNENESVSVKVIKE